MIQRLQVKRNEKGFTLIELLIVIIVLGILAAIVVFAVGSTRKDSVASSCKTNYKAVELSAEASLTKLGHYPVGVVTYAGPATNPLIATDTNGALLKTWPTPAGSDYLFKYVGPAATTTTPQAFTIEVHKKGTTFNAAGAPTPATGSLATGTGVDACTGL